MEACSANEALALNPFMGKAKFWLFHFRNCSRSHYFLYERRQLDEVSCSRLGTLDVAFSRSPSDAAHSHCLKQIHRTKKLFGEERKCSENSVRLLSSAASLV